MCFLLDLTSQHAKYYSKEIKNYFPGLFMPTVPAQHKEIHTQCNGTINDPPKIPLQVQMD